MITNTKTSHYHTVDLDKLTNGEEHKLSFTQDGNPVVTMTGEQFSSVINAAATVGIERLHHASQKLFEDGIMGRADPESGRAYIIPNSVPQTEQTEESACPVRNRGK